MLEYAGANYEHRTIKMSKPEWLEIKHSLGFDFPNLPYYQEGELRLTQSQAILRHLARKFQLEGRDEAARARADMATDQLCEVRGKLHGLCFDKEFSMEMLEQWVAATGPFASFPWGTPLQKTLGSLERYHYDSKQHLTWYALCVLASCGVMAAAGLRGTASPSLTSWPGRCWITCTVLYVLYCTALYCRC